MELNYNGQSKQDEFVSKILNKKENGYFVELGSHHPISINNTYIFEKKLNWKGIMVEYEDKWLPMYKTHRPNSHHIIQNAEKINYGELFKDCNAPTSIDYLQIDLEPSNGSTINVLKKLDIEVMDDYTFSVITFEHDIYSGDFYNTRQLSREILTKRGYILVFPDVKNNGNPYEDWYVHTSFVDINIINKIKTSVSLEYSNIIKML
jgi:hypothetical protein